MFSMRSWGNSMRSGIVRKTERSKKGITLTELIVAMTLTSIFAVICIALINPISNLYQKTVKLSRAQLLADSIIDGIRKECDGIKFDDKNSVWIANFDESKDDELGLLTEGPKVLRASNTTGGNALIIQKNNNYAEAIYSCVSISEKDLQKVQELDDGGQKTGHAVEALFKAGTDNLNKGKVHFGYYKAKENDAGVFPFQAYDYTNPVLASTYGKYTVKLEFSNLTFKEIVEGTETKKTPSYVECKIKVYDGNYYDSDVAFKGPIYTRSTVISFSANGSGVGTGSASHLAPDKRTEIDVKVIWVNEKNEPIVWPVESIKVSLFVNGIFKQQCLFPKDRAGYKFSGIEINDNDEVQITSDTFADYIVTYSGKVSRGYVIKYQYKPKEDTVWLLKGEDFKKVLQTDVDYVVFGSKSMITAEETKAYFEAAGTPSKVSIKIHTTDSSEGKRTDDYVLYRYKDPSSGEITAYILSSDGYFVANSSCYNMFGGCKKLKNITGLTQINTQYTKEMNMMFADCYLMRTFDLPNFVTPTCTRTDRMFSNCYSACSFNLSGWQTQNVTTMQKMFQEVHSATVKDGINYSPNQEMSQLDISSFDFSSCTDTSFMFGWRYHNDDPVPTERTIKKIKLPSEPRFSNSKNINMENMFCECLDLEEIENISVLSGARASSCKNMFKNCKSLTTINIPFPTTIPCTTTESMFDGCISATTIALGDWNMSKNKSCKNMFRNCSSLGSVSIPIQQASIPCESAENMFDGCSSMTSVSLGDWNMSNNKSCKNMFRNCSSLTSVSIKMQTDTLCATTESMFEGCTNITSISLGTWNMAANTTMLKMFKNCSSLTDIMSFETKTLTNVQNMNELYYGCTSLGKNDDSVSFSVNMPSCLYANYVFYGCTSLNEVSMNDANFGSCTQAKQLFAGCTSLTKVYMERVHFDSCTDLSNMFQNCSSLTHIYMENIHMNKVTNLNFLMVNTLKYLYLPHAELNSVTSLKELFKNKTALTEVDFSNVELPACTTCELMFYGCTSLTTVSMNNFKTSLADGTGISYKSMFQGCTSLTNLVDMTGWETSYISDISFMFKNCTGITSLKAKLEFPRIKYVDGVFAGCTGLTSVDLSNSSFRTSSSDTYTVNELFSGCSSLTSAKLNDAVFEKCGTFQSVFKNCNAMTEVYMERIDLKDCTTVSNIFSNCTSLTHIYMSGAYLNKLESMLNVIPTNAEYLDFSSAKLHSISSLEKAFEGRAFTYIDFTDTELNICTSYKYMFQNCTSLETVKWSPVTTISEPSISCEGMFKNCSSVVSFELGSWDSSQVDNMSYMFSGCKGVLNFDFSNSLNSSNVTDMSYMFYDCQKTARFDLTGLVTSNVTTMKGMFYGCHSATSFNLSTWNTSKVTNMSEMFMNCYCLTQFDSSAWTAWNTSNVTTMTYMFYNCCYNGSTDQNIPTGDKYINISNFSFAKVTDTSYMFSCNREKDQLKENTKDIIDKVYLPSVANGGNPVANELINTTKMFDCREHLSEIENLYEFTTDDSLVYARAMFARVNCTKLNIYNIAFGHLNNTKDSSAYIFDNCTSLVTIYVKPGTVYSNIFDDQFNNDMCIVGGAGYTYHGKGNKYARVDGLNGNGGYFTEWTGV